MKTRYKRFVSDWIDHFVQADGGIRTYRVDEYNLDQINAGKLLFGAFERTGDERYRKALDLLREQLRTQPRTPQQWILAQENLSLPNVAGWHLYGGTIPG